MENLDTIIYNGNYNTNKDEGITMENEAVDYLLMNDIREATDKLKTIEMIKKTLTASGINYNQIKALQDISGKTKDTCWAWLNKSRTNIKMPFLDMCKFSIALDIDIERLLLDDYYGIYKRKYAVVENLDDTINILKCFDNKDAAMEYSNIYYQQKKCKISVIRAFLNAENDIYLGVYETVKVLDPGI